MHTRVGQWDGNGDTIAILDVLICHHAINFPDAWDLPTWDLVVLWLG